MVFAGRQAISNHHDVINFFGHKHTNIECPLEIVKAFNERNV